jgi:murein DD-endopeptidase MepM/ murein hydrolase activator NlpD
VAPRYLAHGSLLVLALAAALYAAFAGPDRARLAQELVSGTGLGQDQNLRQSHSGQSLADEAAGSLTEPAGPAQRLGGLNLGASLPAGLCEPGDTAAYCVYTVKEGDTLSGIAELFQLNGGVVPGWELLAASNKPDIVDVDDFIQPGQKLRVPLARGVVYTVLLGESVGLLAQEFDVSSAEIIDANALANPDLLTTGQVVFIPDPNRLPSPELPGAPGAAEPAPPRGFIWPITVLVRITNYMTDRHPLGIDMGLSHAPGTPIVAVEDGVVEFAGGNACCSYGLYVIVDHGNGLKTLYAHLASLAVSKGQRVSQGQSLGPSGRTGYSTGVHLHFEVYKDGKRQNPIDYLP